MKKVLMKALENTLYHFLNGGMCLLALSPIIQASRQPRGSFEEIFGLIIGGTFLSIWVAYITPPPGSQSQNHPPTGP